jgi:hypothetical protein
MRFMMMHKHDPQTEAALPPTRELVENMGSLIAEYGRTGRFIDGAGLGASKTRTRLVFRGARCTIEHGPYGGEHELPAAMLLLKVRTREEAIGWAERYGKILGEGELELGKVSEPWDLGLMPVPENPPLQLLLIQKAPRAGQPSDRSAKAKTELTRLKTEMTKAGVLVRATSLKPSSEAKRLVFRGNQMKTIDGPFSDSKELIGGLMVLELADMEEAVALCRRYAAILGGTLEMDIRLVDEIETPPA